MSVGGLLVATAVVACCLACTRAVSTIMDEPMTGLAMYVAIMAGIVSVVSLLTVVPGMIATLKLKRGRLELAISVLIILLLFAVAVAGPSMISGGTMLKSIVYAVPASVSYSVALIVPLLVARKLGYRLYSRRQFYTK